MRWRDPRTGTQPRRRLPNKPAAQRTYADALHIEGLDPRTPGPRRKTVAELIAEEAIDAGRTTSTHKTRRSYLTNHLPTWLLDRDAHLVVIEHIEAVLQEAGKKLCEESVMKLRSILHSVFKYGVERRIVDRNPVTGARIRGTCQVSARARKVVNQEVDPNEIPSPLECQAIARAIQPRFGVLVRSLYILGLRLGEAVALDVSDWNPETRILRVHRSGPLFPGSRGGRLTPENFRTRYFYPAVDEALEQKAKDEHKRRRIRPHDLRHTAASIMITQGVSDMEIGKQLGHENSAVTRKIYAGVWRRAEREVSEKLHARVAQII